MLPISLTLVDVVVISPAAFLLGLLVGFLLGRGDLRRTGA